MRHSPVGCELNFKYSRFVIIRWLSDDYHLTASQLFNYLVDDWLMTTQKLINDCLTTA